MYIYIYMSKRNYSVEKTAGIILINQNLDKILLIKSLNGFWGFPKGHREKEDKSTLANAIREVKEEIGIKVKKDQIIPNKKDIVNQYFFRRHSKNLKERKNGWIKKEIVLFTAIIDDKKAIKKQDIEIAKYKWMNFDKAVKVITDTEIKNFGKLGSIPKKYIKIINKTRRFANKMLKK